MSKKYIIKNALGTVIDQDDDLIFVFKLVWSFIKNNKDGYANYFILEQDENGALEKVATMGGMNGMPNLSFGLVSRWSKMEKAAGRPGRLDDFYAAVGLCRKCRGWGKFTNVPKVYLPCRECNGTGKHKMKRHMTLWVVEQVPGQPFSIMAVESGDAETCMKAYKTLRASGQYDDDGQFRIEEDGKVIAIEVHGAMLWLTNVPPPKYFTPPEPPKVVVTGFNVQPDTLLEKRLEAGCA